MDNNAVFKLLLHSERLHHLAQNEDCYPISVEIDPTNLCPHSCIFCSSHVTNKQYPETLETPIIERLLDDLAINPEVQSVVWKGGGEPLLHPVLSSFIVKAHNLKLDQGLTTNGTLLNRLSPEVIKYLQWTRISLDAATAATHHIVHQTKDFDRIIDNINYYVTHKGSGHIGLNMNVSPENYHEIDAFLMLGMRLKVDYVAIRVAYYQCFGYDNPYSDQFYSYATAKLAEFQHMQTGPMQVIIGQVANLGRVGSYVADTCLAPVLRAIVSATGDVAACCDLRGLPEYSFGNLHEDNFWSIWASDRRKEVLQRTKDKVCLPYCSRAYDFYNQALDFLRDPSKQRDPKFM
jgi:MoaA/NifB/PqqE/SkfB family radical SAM enzyme